MARGAPRPGLQDRHLPSVGLACAHPGRHRGRLAATAGDGHRLARSRSATAHRSREADRLRHRRPRRHPGTLMDTDAVTVADRLAEHALTEIFRRADPGCLVVGEEGVYADPTPLAALPHAELAWVIDPVDGTRNFTEGSPDFAVMVAEVRAGVTTRSWIWQPVHDLMMIAERGAGVTRNGVAVVPPVRPKPLVGALHGRYGHPRGGVPDDVRLVRLAGCCGVDYPDLIEGRRAFLGYWSM